MENKLEITDNAQKHIASIIASDNSKYFRITVLGGGCAGFQYKFDFDNQKNIDDIILKTKKVTVIIDTTSLELIKGSNAINEACNTLFKVTGTDLKLKYMEERHEAKYAWSTWDKSVELLGFEHKIDLEEGLTKMWDWAQEQPQRPRQTWGRYELDKGIYDYWKN